MFGPTIVALKVLGGSGTIQEINATAIEQQGYTDDQQAVMHGDGNQTELENHVHPPFGQEAFPCSDRDVDGFFLAVQTGAWATGLPPAPRGDNERCTASGQARAVIALWAGAAASPDGARTLRDVTDEGAIDGATLITFPEWDGPPMWGVEYAVADAEVALAMLELPAGEVRTALERAWNHWTNPQTTTSMLVNEFGIAQPTAQAAPASADCP